MSWAWEALAAAVSRPGFPVLAAACLAAGVVRGFSGFGVALVFMPVAAIFAPAGLALATLNVFNAFGTFSLLGESLRRCARGEVAVMLGGVLIGTPVGVWLLATLPDLTLRWFVCLAALAAALALASGWRATGAAPRWIGAPVGAAAGLMGGIAGLSGVPVVLFYLGRSAEPAAMRANIVVLFAASSVVSAALLWRAGFFGTEAVALGLVLAPLFLCGVEVGKRLFPLAPETLFRRLAFGLIFFAALSGLPLWD